MRRSATRSLALPVVSAVAVWSNVGYTTLFFVAGEPADPGDAVADHRCQSMEFVHVAAGHGCDDVSGCAAAALFLVFQRHIVRSIVVTGLK